MDFVSLPQHYARVAQVLQPFMPSTCHFFDKEAVSLIGTHPVAAGGFADIWEATYDNRKVALKSYRCYVLFDAACIVKVRRDYDPYRVVHI